MAECRCFGGEPNYGRIPVSCSKHGKGTEWDAIEPVWVDDDKELTIQRIHSLDDCMRFGNIMGHCAGHHTALVQYGAWKFYAVFDKEMKPHNSIHLRTVEAPDKEVFAKFLADHPNLGFYSTYKFHGYDVSAPWEKVKEYLPSKDADKHGPEPERYSEEWYNWRNKVGPRTPGMVPIGIEGVPHFILSASVRGQYDNTNHPVTQVTYDWYNANKMDELGLVGITSVKRDKYGFVLED